MLSVAQRAKQSDNDISTGGTKRLTISQQEKQTSHAFFLAKPSHNSGAVYIFYLINTNPKDPLFYLVL